MSDGHTGKPGRQHIVNYDRCRMSIAYVIHVSGLVKEAPLRRWCSVPLMRDLLVTHPEFAVQGVETLVKMHPIEEDDVPVLEPYCVMKEIAVYAVIVAPPQPMVFHADIRQPFFRKQFLHLARQCVLVLHGIPECAAPPIDVYGAGEVLWLAAGDSSSAHNIHIFAFVVLVTEHVADFHNLWNLPYSVNIFVRVSVREYLLKVIAVFVSVGVHSLEIKTERDSALSGLRISPSS